VLALGKRVVVLDNAANRELESMLHNPSLHEIGSIAELGPLLAKFFEEEPPPPPANPRRWYDTAQEYARVFPEILSCDFDADRIRAGWQLLRTIDSASRPDF
jgi:hypothetical protein